MAELGPATRSVVLADAEALARTVAAGMVRTIVAAQVARGVAHVVLTGGTSGTAALRALAVEPARDQVNWQQVHLWWGDERYLPAGHLDRNEVQAAAAFSAAVPVPPGQVHVMPADAEGDGSRIGAAAEAYAQALANAADGSGPTPLFDLLLLGVGPDGHVASLFPGHPMAVAREVGVVAVHDSPKPPPLRLSLTVAAINRARQVWLLAAGDGKAEAVATARAQAVTDSALPAARVRGTEETWWFLDAAAAAQ